MRHLGSLRRTLHWLNSARDLTIESKNYQWEAAPPMTFFLQAEQAVITLTRHDKPQILAKVELQAGFGWQMTAEQDEAGVYLIARRKPLIGSIGRGAFDIALPADIHIALKLTRCQLRFDKLNATLDFPPHSF